MGRFESPCQIATLFMGATLVAAGVIFVLRIEALKRYGSKGQDEVPVEMQQINTQNDEKASFLSKVARDLEYLKSFIADNKGDSTLRQKRSPEEFDEQKFASELGEHLFTESLNNHKLRNVAEKVAKLDPKTDQITSEILRQFCPKPVNHTDHKFPPIFSHLGPEVESDSTSTPVKRNHIACQSYGQLVTIVILTTIVNFTLVGMVLICKTIKNCHKRTKNPARIQDEFLDDYYYSKDVTPIIKSVSHDITI